MAQPNVCSTWIQSEGSSNKTETNPGWSCAGVSARKCRIILCSILGSETVLSGVSSLMKLIVHHFFCRSLSPLLSLNEIETLFCGCVVSKVCASAPTFGKAHQKGTHAVLGHTNPYSICMSIFPSFYTILLIPLVR